MRPSHQLLQPLESALSKSMIRNYHEKLNAQRVNQQVKTTSRISKRMRSLSPEQVNYIKSSTKLPTDKILVPTNHLWKVRGKQFSAVGYEIRQGQPIPAHLMHIPPDANNYQVTTQTVYQTIPKKQQIRNLHTTRSHTTLKTLFPPRKYTTRYLKPITTKITFSNLPQQITTTTRVLSQPAAYEYIRLIPPKNSNVNQPISQDNTDKQNVINGKYNDLSQKNSTQISDRSRKKIYRYNCFSAIDEAMNTKCGSCGRNQIIATKPSPVWE